MNKMENFEIKGKSELIDTSLEKIKMMTKTFSISEFYELENKIAVIVITPCQVAIAYAPIYINESNDGTDYGHYTAHREMFTMLRKKICGDTDSFNIGRTAIDLRLYSSNVYNMCYPLYNPAYVKNITIKKSMMEIIKRIYAEVNDTNKYIDVSMLERFLRDARQTEDIETIDENLIGLKHSEFLKILMSEENRTDSNIQPSIDSQINDGDER